MAMVLLRGTVSEIGTREKKTEKLEIMKFVLETDGGPIEVELINKSIDFFLKSRNLGDKIGVNIELQGRKSEYSGKTNFFTSMRCVNTFPIFTRGDDSPNGANGMGSGSGGYGASNSASNGQSNSGYGAQGHVPPAPQDDLPF